jgi:3-phenylpropionate/cinnamic acid dioxygenase small subunit
MEKLMIPTWIIEQRKIEDLFIRYTCAIDAGDVETLVECFSENGSLESPAVGCYSGRDAIREFAKRFAKFLKNGSQLRHIISNIRSEVDGNHAKAKCYLLVYITKNGNSKLLAPGTYECDLVKIKEEWYFNKRIVTMDHDYILEGI